MGISKETIQIALTTGTESERSEAFDFILKSWGNMAMGFVMKRGGTHEDAEEILWDALYYFDRNLRERKYNGEGNVEAYFINIVAKQWFKRLEKKNRQQRLFDFFQAQQYPNEIESSALQWYEQKEAIEMLLKIIDSKGKHCKDLLRLYQLDYSLEETSLAMGWNNVDRVKTEKKRCIQRTREELRQHPEWKSLFKD